MNMFEELSKRDHEQVVFCHDKESGLKAIIAIHNTLLGPALGGCRVWPYKTEADALEDVLRLSRGMTYKSAAAGLNLGGGKAVVIADPKTMKTEKLFRSFGRFVQSLSGRYITAADVGVADQDIAWISMETNYVTGIDPSFGGSGDPSPVTAYGVFQGLKAAIEFKLGTDSFKNLKVAIQGVGQVGFHLIEHLSQTGVKIVATDVNGDNIKKTQLTFPAVEFVDPDKIYDIDCDIFIPCALGGVVNDNTLPRFKCQIIAGSANNVLDDENKHSIALQEKGILYVPDFVINSGGIINVYNELISYNYERALKQTGKIYHIIKEILSHSAQEKIVPLKAANQIAEKRLIGIGSERRNFIGNPLHRPVRGIG